MIELLRLVSDALGHASYGINAKIPGVPRVSPDTVPPNVATVLDEFEDPELARGVLPEPSATVPYPLVAVFLAGDVDLEGETPTGRQDGQVEIAVQYAALLADTKQGNQDAAYTSRAIRRSVRTWMDNTNATARTTNSLSLISLTAQRVSKPRHEENGKLVVLTVVNRFDVRDSAP